MKEVCQLDVNNLPLSLLADVEVGIILLPQTIVLALSLGFEGHFLMRLRGKERLTHDRGKVILASFHRFRLGHLAPRSNSCEWLCWRLQSCSRDQLVFNFLLNDVEDPGRDLSSAFQVL